MVRDFPFFSRRRLRRESPARISPPAHYLLATPPSPLPRYYTGHGSFSDESILDLERERYRKRSGSRLPKPKIKSNRSSLAENVSQVLREGKKKRPRLRREKRQISRAAARGFDFGIERPEYRNGIVTPPWEHYETDVPINPYARLSRGTFGEGLWSPSPPTPPPSRPIKFRDPAQSTQAKRRMSNSPVSPLDAPLSSLYHSTSVPARLVTDSSASRPSRSSSTRERKSRHKDKRVRFSPSRLDEPFSAPAPVEYAEKRRKKRRSSSIAQYGDIHDMPTTPPERHSNQSQDYVPMQANNYSDLNPYGVNTWTGQASSPTTKHKDVRRDRGYFSMGIRDDFKASHRPISAPQTNMTDEQHHLGFFKANDIPDGWRGQNKVRRRIKEIEMGPGERTSRKRERHQDRQVQYSEDEEAYETTGRHSKKRNLQKINVKNPMYGNRTFWVEDEDDSMWLPSTSCYL